MNELLEAVELYNDTVIRGLDKLNDELRKLLESTKASNQVLKEYMEAKNESIR